MGIDRSNVRCVIHAAMPKSIEHYQQETGRAGRDGLEAECVMLYSAADARRWEFIVNSSAAEGQLPPAVVASHFELLRQVQQFATSTECRHALLSRYFGQEYEQENCGACDVCTDAQTAIDDGGSVARLLLGAVDGVRGSFGASHVIDVVSGSRSMKVTRNGHDLLPQHGSLRRFNKEALKEFVGQLVSQGLLHRTVGEMPLLKLTARGREALEGNVEPVLTLREQQDVALGSADYDRDLFDVLRDLRKQLAAERNVAAFVIFSDVTLRELAAVRPSSVDALAGIKGIGERKSADLGGRVVSAIVEHCRRTGLAMDVRTVSSPRAPRIPGSNASRDLAFRLFDEGEPLEGVADATGRALSTVVGYLEEHITLRKPENVDAWVSPERYRLIEAAARRTSGTLLKPVFEALEGQATYEEIRIVMRHAGLR
jgi:ATP-dependent DNA helicase RecQ